MRIQGRVQGPAVITAIVAAVVLPGCATVPNRARFVPTSCEFVVYNQTSHALEIRMRVRRLSTTPIGALNPGELMTYSVPCAQRAVWIGGIPIPPQVGARVAFSFVEGWADLVEGERVEIALHWP